MKIGILTLIAIFGLGSIAMAQKTETVVVKRGHQGSAAKGEVILKFVSVIEDSRCPTDVNCIWAGNAKLEVLITDKHGGSKRIVVNTTTGPTGDQYNGWAIYLTSLTPSPKSGKKINQRSYVATFNVTRLFR